MAFALETQNLHPSTLLCLHAIQDLPETFAPDAVQDLGCGNGILTIVASQLWPKASITAVDISENAVRDAQAAAKAQNVTNRLQVVQNDVFLYLKGDLARTNGPFALSLCNLLADILIPAAPALKESVTPEGYAILSGILAWQAAEIEALYTSLGFEIAKKYEDSPWVCYTLCHKCETIANPIVTKA